MLSSLVVKKNLFLACRNLILLRHINFLALTLIAL